MQQQSATKVILISGETVGAQEDIFSIFEF